METSSHHDGRIKLIQLHQRKRIAIGSARADNQVAGSCAGGLQGLCKRRCSNVTSLDLPMRTPLNLKVASCVILRSQEGT
jgi:hypothetical protein